MCGFNPHLWHQKSRRTMFTSNASRILYIATSTYHKSQFFSLEEWLEARELVKNRKDLSDKLDSLRAKSATSFGVV